MTSIPCVGALVTKMTETKHPYAAGLSRCQEDQLRA